MLPSTSLLPRGEALFRFPPINIPEIFKNFFAYRIVLAANNQYPGNIQRLFRLQNCLSRKSSISRKYSKTFRPASSIPATTSNHPAINSSNQHQQSTAATSSSNQQQQPAAATSSSNQQQQPAAAISNHRSTALTQPPSTVRQTSARLMPASVSYHYGS